MMLLDLSLSLSNIGFPIISAPTLWTNKKIRKNVKYIYKKLNENKNHPLTGSFREESVHSQLGAVSITLSLSVLNN